MQIRATVESVLVYGSISWTLTSALEKKIDGSYTRMLRAALNKSWTDHLSNAELYGRLRFAGHCWRSKNELSSEVLLWEPSHGKRSRGRPRKTYVDQLIADTAYTYEDLANLMDDRDRWKELVNESRASST